MAKIDKISEEIEELKAQLDKAREEAEYYRKLTEAGDGAHKSEAVKELFDFDNSKLPQRTRLNEKEILTFATLKTNMQILDPKEHRLWPVLFMDNIMEMKISYKGLGREEGMGIFRLQSEEKDMQDGYKP
jgi:hypothetical protein